MAYGDPYTSIDPATGIASYGTRSYARFYSDKKLMVAQSEQAGRPIYAPVDMVEIIIPGEKGNIPCYEASIKYQMQFPQEWAAYKAGKEQEVAGTPLTFLFPNDPSLQYELESHRIKTVEQLAALSDTGVAAIPRGLTLVQSARDYLSRANNREDEVAALKARIAALEAAKAEAPKRGPGRPPKKQAEPEPQQMEAA
jgi:hypothetical protein